jgi:hypothetical protein
MQIFRDFRRLYRVFVVELWRDTWRLARRPGGVPLLLVLYAAVCSTVFLFGVFVAVVAGVV